MLVSWGRFRKLTRSFLHMIADLILDPPLGPVYHCRPLKLCICVLNCWKPQGLDYVIPPRGLGVRHVAFRSTFHYYHLCLTSASHCNMPDSQTTSHKGPTSPQVAIFSSTARVRTNPLVVSKPGWLRPGQIPLRREEAVPGGAIRAAFKSPSPELPGIHSEADERHKMLSVLLLTLSSLIPASAWIVSV